MGQHLDSSITPPPDDYVLDVHDLGEDVEVGVEQRAGAEDAGGGNTNVQSVFSLDDLCKDGAHLALVGLSKWQEPRDRISISITGGWWRPDCRHAYDVAVHVVHDTTKGRCVVSGFFEGVGLFRRKIDAVDGGASFDQAEGHLEAQAAGGAGDDANAVAEGELVEDVSGGLDGGLVLGPLASGGAAEDGLFAAGGGQTLLVDEGGGVDVSEFADGAAVEGAWGLGGGGGPALTLNRVGLRSAFRRVGGGQVLECLRCFVHVDIDEE